MAPHEIHRDPPEPLITLPQAREILTVSRASLFRMIACGEFPVIRIGGRTMIEACVLREYIAAHRVHGPRNDNGPATNRAEVTTSAEDGGGVDEA
jgi:predicted DNA-binding transcriptional regulator AlpA